MTELTLKARIQEDMKTAMKAQDARRLGVIRLLMAAIKQKEIDERPARGLDQPVILDDTEVLAVIDKMLKQRQDSASQFKAAGRLDLVEQEDFEITVLQTYMPTPLSEAEVDVLLQEAVACLGASSMKDMGKVVAHLKPILQGRADMGMVSAKIKQKLQ